MIAEELERLRVEASRLGYDLTPSWDEEKRWFEVSVWRDWYRSRVIAHVEDAVMGTYVVDRTPNIMVAKSFSFQPFERISGHPAHVHNDIPRHCYAFATVLSHSGSLPGVAITTTMYITETSELIPYTVLHWHKVCAIDPDAIPHPLVFDHLWSISPVERKRDLHRAVTDRINRVLSKGISQNRAV